MRRDRRKWVPFIDRSRFLILEIASIGADLFTIRLPLVQIEALPLSLVGECADHPMG